jgi:Tfp pilus assembly protein PilZ
MSVDDPAEGMDDRRRFRRLNLPLFYRPARLLGPRQPARDVSRGGIRVYTDDALSIGTRLEIELFLPDGSSLSVDVRVAWVQELSGKEKEAGYEAGLEFLAMHEVHRALLERCLAENKEG